MTQLKARNFEMPAWFAEEALADRISGAGLKVLVALFAFGREEAGEYGERRCYLQMPADDFAKLADVSRSTLFRVQPQLVERGYLTVHRLVKDTTPQAISSPYDLFESPGFAPAPVGDTQRIQAGAIASQERDATTITVVGDSGRGVRKSDYLSEGVSKSDPYQSQNRTPAVLKSDPYSSSGVSKSDPSLTRAGTGWSGGGGGEVTTTNPVSDQSDHTTTTIRARGVRKSDLLQELSAFGFNRPLKVLKDFGDDQCRVALALTREAMRQSAGTRRPIQNPPGFALQLLRDAKLGGYLLEEPEAGPEAVRESSFDVNAKYRDLALEMFGQLPPSLSPEQFARVRELVLGGHR